MNPEFNQLFYLIKYQSVLLDKIPNLFTKIQTLYNDQIAHLLQLVMVSPKGFYNLFLAHQSFNPNAIYPNGYLVNEQKPIIQQDKTFITNSLFKFVNDGNESQTILYLDKDLKYVKLPANFFQDLFPAEHLNNQALFNRFIDELSVSYNTVQNFLTMVQDKLDDLYDFQLSPNYLDLMNIAQSYGMQAKTNTSYSLMIMVGFGIVNFVLLLCFFTNYQKVKGVKYE